MSGVPRPPRRPADLLTAVMSRGLKLGPARNKITIERALQVPTRDGTVLLADHYAPVTTSPRPTVLMRCPYGRGPQFAIGARPLAERGYARYPSALVLPVLPRPDPSALAPASVHAARETEPGRS